MSTETEAPKADAMKLAPQATMLLVKNNLSPIKRAEKSNITLTDEARRNILENSKKTLDDLLFEILRVPKHLEDQLTVGQRVLPAHLGALITLPGEEYALLDFSQVIAVYEE